MASLAIRAVFCPGSLLKTKEKLLLSVLHSVGKNLDNNIQTDILYLDFAKAFDSVDHAILLEKLERYGVAGHYMIGSRTI